MTCDGCLTGKHQGSPGTSATRVITGTGVHVELTLTIPYNNVTWHGHDPV